MARLLISYGIPMEGLSLPPHFEVDHPPKGEAFTRRQMLDLLPTADAVLACTALDAEMIQEGRQLKIIVCYGAGYDAINIDAASRAGIPVVNIPDTVTEATAELAISFLLALARRLHELNPFMHQQNRADAFSMGKNMGMSLAGSTLGIVGLGRIGSRVADFGRFMNMNILYASISPKKEQERLGAVHCSLETLMATSDFVSIHCPHTPQTELLIHEKLLLLMKPTAYFINTARGKVVDEAALLEILKKGRIAGAGLDVFWNEPNINPEWSTLPNVLLTPHVGSNTIQCRRSMIASACKQIETVLSGIKPQNLLNPEVWKG